MKSGLAVVISNKKQTEKRMEIGKRFAGQKMIDALGNCKDMIEVDKEGFANFKVMPKSVSIWVEV